MAHLVLFNKNFTWKVYIWIPVDVALLSHWPNLNPLLTFRKLRQKKKTERKTFCYLLGFTTFMQLRKTFLHIFTLTLKTMWVWRFYIGGMLTGEASISPKNWLDWLIVSAGACSTSQSNELDYETLHNN